MSKNSKIKKKIGEKAYQFLTRNYSGSFLEEHLPTLFGLLSDIKYIKESEFTRLKALLNKKLDEPEKAKKPVKTAKELLDEAGFILDDEISTKEDYLKYNKYFNQKESLCKFRTYDATKDYHKVFWILRKNIDDIKRPEKPSRQDEYSTSCMSVGISKDKATVGQITSRYNHTVSACDNTYNSNLDNIVEGLTEAFNQDYGLNLKKGATIEFDNFYYSSGKFWHYNYEINGKKYGDNTIDGEYYDPSQYFIFENFILDLKNKKIKTAGGESDAFVDLINDYLEKGFKLEIRKGEPEEDIDHDNKIIIYV